MSLPRGVSERCLTNDVDAALVRRRRREPVVLQEVAEHLREVRLAGAEEPRDPDAHDVPGGTATPQRLADLREGVEDPLELVFDLVGDDVLADLGGQRGAVEDLDDAFDLDADVPLDDVPYGGHASLPRLHWRRPSAPEQLDGEVVATVRLVHEVKLAAALLSGEREDNPRLQIAQVRAAPHRSGRAGRARRSHRRSRCRRGLRPPVRSGAPGAQLSARFDSPCCIQR